MNDKEKAIRQLEAAFLKCKTLGISFCGMDDQLLFADKIAINEVKRNADCDVTAGDYCEVARARVSCVGFNGIVNTHSSYMDSGAW